MYSEFEKELPNREGDMLTDWRQQFPFSAFLSPDRVVYTSLHGGGPMLTSTVLKWLEENIGRRDEEQWTWFSDSPSRVEFAFKDEGDAAHFILVWGGNDHDGFYVGYT